MVAAFALGTLLVHDAADGADALAEAGAGDGVRVQGDLHTFEVPGDGWDAIRPLLEKSTYRLHVEGLDALVLVTGLEAGMAQQTVVVEGDLVHSGTHPDDVGSVFVLAAKDVREPFLFR